MSTEHDRDSQIPQSDIAHDQALLAAEQAVLIAVENRLHSLMTDAGLTSYQAVIDTQVRFADRASDLICAAARWKMVLRAGP